MDPRFEAVRAFRRRAVGIEDVPTTDVLRALFVGCSECAAGSALVAALHPDQTLLNHGGVLATDGRVDASVRDTLAYAVDLRGARDVVLVGHSRCTFPAWSGGADLAGRRGTQGHLVAQARAARSLLPDGLRLHAIWIDEDDGDLFELVDLDRPRFELMSDLDLQRMLARIDRV